MTAFLLQQQLQKQLDIILGEHVHSQQVVHYLKLRHVANYIPVGHGLKHSSPDPSLFMQKWVWVARLIIYLYT